MFGTRMISIGRFLCVTQRRTEIGYWVWLWDCARACDRLLGWTFLAWGHGIEFSGSSPNRIFINIQQNIPGHITT